jgi:hypothetical protein
MLVIQCQVYHNPKWDHLEILKQITSSNTIFQIRLDSQVLDGSIFWGDYNSAHYSVLYYWKKNSYDTIYQTLGVPYVLFDAILSTAL